MPGSIKERVRLGNGCTYKWKIYMEKQMKLWPYVGFLCIDVCLSPSALLLMIEIVPKEGIKKIIVIVLFHMLKNCIL